jgi:hypothetical protein
MPSRSFGVDFLTAFTSPEQNCENDHPNDAPADPCNGRVGCLPFEDFPMDGHYSNVPCLAEYDSGGAPVLIENLKQTIARPPLIEINTDISGKTNLLLYLVRSTG